MPSAAASRSRRARVDVARQDPRRGDPGREQPAGERLRHRAASDEADALVRERHAGSSPLRGRAPKIAVPTRTQVAPSSIAISKSADMPIDSSRSAPPPGSLRRLCASSRKRAKPARLASGVACGGGIAISPAIAQMLPREAFREQLAHGRGSGAALRGFALEVHLQQHAELATELGGALFERGAQRSAVQAFDDVEIPRDVESLVALQPPDEVQAGQGESARREQRAQLRELRAGLLHVVLPDVVETGGDRLRDARRRLPLRDADERDRLGSAARAPGRGRHALAHAGQPGRKRARERFAHATPDAKPAARSSASVSSSGSPITFVSLPSIFSISRRPLPCAA